MSASQNEIEVFKRTAVEAYKSALVKELRAMKETYVPVNRVLEIIDAPKPVEWWIAKQPQYAEESE